MDYHEKETSFVLGKILKEKDKFAKFRENEIKDKGSNWLEEEGSIEWNNDFGKKKFIRVQQRQRKAH